MKRKWIFALIVSLFFAGIPERAEAHSTEEPLKIGLTSVCSHAASAKINTTEVLIGEEYKGGFGEGGRMVSANGFTVRKASGDYFAADRVLRMGEAQALSDRLSQNGSMLYLGGNHWTVCSKDRKAVEAIGGAVRTVKGFRGYTLSDGIHTAMLPETAVLAGADGKISVNGRPYRGTMTFETGNGVTAVNVVPMEEYLYGVVSSEVPYTYGREALKAQAVAARTYALTKRGAHASEGYDLCDGNNCQTYKGVSAENPRTTEAVQATAGELVCYQGKPINAVFFASSGGYTENSRDVWGGDVPYLRAVPEIEEFDTNIWTKTLTLSQLDQLLRAKGEKIGSARDIRITKISTGGRVQELKIIGTNGAKTLKRNDIRTYFAGSAMGSLPSKMFTINGVGGVSAGGNTKPTVQGGTLERAVRQNGITARTEKSLADLNGKHLNVPMETENGGREPLPASGSYEIYDVDLTTIQNGKFVFEGRGNGHGVGLSQKGAQGMALAGFDYREILQHYYQGTTLER